MHLFNQVASTYALWPSAKSGNGLPLLTLLRPACTRGEKKHGKRNDILPFCTRDTKVFDDRGLNYSDRCSETEYTSIYAEVVLARVIPILLCHHAVVPGAGLVRGFHRRTSILVSES